MYPDLTHCSYKLHAAVKKQYKQGAGAKHCRCFPNGGTDRFQAGDLIFCHTKSASDVRPGDVIAFFDPSGNGKSIVTHRVESITTDENGSLAWVTKGDANNAKDNAVVPAKNLAGVYRSRIQGLGNAVVFMQTSKGMMVCVVFPILLFVMYDAVRRNRYEKKRIYAMECERRNQV